MWVRYKHGTCWIFTVQIPTLILADNVYQPLRIRIKCECCLHFHSFGQHAYFAMLSILNLLQRITAILGSVKLIVSSFDFHFSSNSLLTPNSLRMNHFLWFDKLISVIVYLIDVYWGDALDLVSDASLVIRFFIELNYLLLVLQQPEQSITLIK